MAGIAAVTLAVVFIYHQATLSYFFNDDFQWLQQAREFRASNLVHLERYAHFYRPVIEIYFYAGHRLFGCAPRPFHVLSLALHVINTLLLFLLARDLSGD